MNGMRTAHVATAPIRSGGSLEETLQRMELWTANRKCSGSDNLNVLALLRGGFSGAIRSMWRRVSQQRLHQSATCRRALRCKR
jgi:hypothetical protein